MIKAMSHGTFALVGDDQWPRSEIIFAIDAMLNEQPYSQHLTDAHYDARFVLRGSFQTDEGKTLRIRLFVEDVNGEVLIAWRRDYPASERPSLEIAWDVVDSFLAIYSK